MSSEYTSEAYRPFNQLHNRAADIILGLSKLNNYQLMIIIK